MYSAREKPTLRQERGGSTRKGPGNDRNQIVNLKNIHSLKAECLCGGNLGDFKPGRQHLQVTLKNAEEEGRAGTTGYREVLQRRVGSLNSKKLLLIKENQITQVKEFSAFLCMGRWKSLGSLKSFL